jgi:hypothetical protein
MNPRAHFLILTAALCACSGGGTTTTTPGTPSACPAIGISSAPVPALQSHTTYLATAHATVLFDSATCSFGVGGNLGSFTTQ